MSEIKLSIHYDRLWITYKPISINNQKGENRKENDVNETDESDSNPNCTQQSEIISKQVHNQTKNTKRVRRICMCPVAHPLDCCRFECANNNSKLEKHTCPLLGFKPLSSIFTAADPTYSPFSLLPSTVIDNLTPQQVHSLNLVFNFTSGTPLSHAHIASSAFNNMCQGLIKLGQTYPSARATDLLPLFNRRRLPVLLEQQAGSALIGFLNTLQGHFVSLMFDAGTINSRHYAAICLCANNSEAKPSFLQLANAPSSKQDYQIFVYQILRELCMWNIEVASICTDGLPVQIQALSEFVNVLRMGGNIGDLNLAMIPFHVPCLNHRINLVVKEIGKIPRISILKTTLNKFADDAHRKVYHTLLGKSCPFFIETRWLSLGLQSSFVRLKREIILKEEMLPYDILEDAMKLEIVLTPLIELQLFFETHSTKLCHAYPAIIRTLLQYLLLLQEEIFKHDVWLYAIVTVICSLYNNTLADETGSLLELSFVLSFSGKILYKTSKLASGYNPNKSLQESFLISEQLKSVGLNRFGFFLLSKYLTFFVFLIIFVSSMTSSYIRMLPDNWKDVFVPLSLDTLNDVSLSSVDITSLNAPSPLEYGLYDNMSNTEVVDLSNLQSLSEHSNNLFPHFSNKYIDPQVQQSSSVLTTINDSKLDLGPSTSSYSNESNFNEDSLILTHHIDGESAMEQPNTSDSIRDFVLHLPSPDDRISSTSLHLGETSVSAFRSAIQTSQQVPLTIQRNPLSNNNTSPINNDSIKERWLMKTDELIKIFKCFKDNVQNGSDEDESLSENFDEFGCLAAEQRELQQEYVDEIANTDDQHWTYSTRTAILSSQTSSYSLDSLSPASVDIHQFESIFGDDNMDDDIEFIGSSGRIYHSTYTTDEKEWMKVKEVFVTIYGRYGPNLQRNFERHLKNVLAPKWHLLIGPMLQLFEQDINDLSTSSFSMLQSNQLNNNIFQPFIKQIYNAITSTLLYTVISESECERIFSKTHHITGKRRNNFLTQTLNYNLILSYHGSAS